MKFLGTKRDWDWESGLKLGLICIFAFQINFRSSDKRDDRQKSVELLTNKRLKQEKQSKRLQISIEFSDFYLIKQLEYLHLKIIYFSDLMLLFSHKQRKITRKKQVKLIRRFSYLRKFFKIMKKKHAWVSINLKRNIKRDKIPPYSNR